MSSRSVLLPWRAESDGQGLREALASYPRRRSSSPVGVAIGLVVLSVMAVMIAAAFNREAAGEPVLPATVSQWLNKSDPAMPPGLNYDLSALDPTTMHPTEVLPQLGTVQLRLAITNDTALPMTFNFSTAEQCEFTVRRIYTFLGGWFVVPLEVWNSSYFHNYSRKPTRLTLAPGQTKVYTADWTVNGLTQLQVPPGEYRVYTSFQGIKPLFITKPL